VQLLTTQGTPAYVQFCHGNYPVFGSLAVYAQCTGSKSVHAVARYIRQPITQRVHVYHTNACQ